MKKLILFSIVFSMLISGCQEEKPISFRNLNFSEQQLSECEKVGCPDIDISYIVAAGDEERSILINEAIERFIVEVLYLGDETDVPKATNIEEAAQGFIAMFRTHSAEFPDMQVEYYAEINILDSYSSIDLVSLELNYYLYTGGAHGYGGTKYMNFDGRSGLLLDKEDLVKDLPGLERFAETVFRNTYQIPENAGINSTGFWFQEERFHLPESFGFSPDSLLVTYDPYVISNYAAGSIQLKLPMKEIATFITIPIK